MQSKSQEIQEVVIYANRQPIFYRGDTLVYVADSFKVHEGAVVEDLLKKLPGIKLDKNGNITSQGQEISQVLVDGDEFFGSDVLKNDRSKKSFQILVSLYVAWPHG